MASIKERPRTRKAIIEQGFKPSLIGRIWDGVTMVRVDGSRSSPSRDLKLQLRKMVDEGYFGTVFRADKKARDESQEAARRACLRDAGLRDLARIPRRGYGR